MSTYTATRALRARRETIHAILINVAELAEWNPAIYSIDTRHYRAKLGLPYPAATRLPGHAALTYTLIEPSRIGWRLESPGATEDGLWELSQMGDGTRVTHTMNHSGAVFAMLRHAMTPVPNYRLDRLQDRAERGGSASA